jgi:hypothetical protein
MVHPASFSVNFLMKIARIEPEIAGNPGSLKQPPRNFRANPHPILFYIRLPENSTCACIPDGKD